MKKYLNWSTLRLVLILGIVCFLYSFMTKRNEDRKLKEISVEFFGDEQLFMTHETVNKLLIENNEEVTSIGKVGLDLNTLENTIKKHEMVDEAEVFLTIDGKLKAIVTQKTPVARVYEQGSSYYIDNKGNEMPISAIYTARVPLVSGEIKAENSEKLDELFRLIYEDDFLRKNIIGVQILPNGSLRMKNRNYNYDIEFGRTINMEQKFKNYKAFLQKAVLDSSIYKYKKINLKFTQQVVCTK
jgi:cell division protein FtsQ